MGFPYKVAQGSRGNFEIMKVTKLNISLKSGYEYLGVECPDDFLTDKETFVGFYYEGGIKMIPVERIYEIDVYKEEREEIE